VGLSRSLDLEDAAQLGDGVVGHGHDRAERPGEQEGFGGGFEDLEAIEGV
jgi:hypothetical protein